MLSLKITYGIFVEIDFEYNRN